MPTWAKRLRAQFGRYEIRRHDDRWMLRNGRPRRRPAPLSTRLDRVIVGGPDKSRSVPFDRVGDRVAIGLYGMDVAPEREARVGVPEVCGERIRCDVLACRP